MGKPDLSQQYKSLFACERETQFCMVKLIKCNISAVGAYDELCQYIMVRG